MILRALALMAGIGGGAVASQFPEFSQQYVQRVGGYVDRLSEEVAQLDRDAASLGQSREAFLSGLAGGGPQGRLRAQALRDTVQRRDRLFMAMDRLADAGALERALHFRSLADADLIRRTQADFRPALPLSVEGAGFACAGFLAVWAGLGALLAGLRALFRRRRAA